MKSALIAMGMAMSVGTAMAENTVYGKVDLGLVSNHSSAVGAIDQGLVAASGSYEGSRFGLKGGSDVGSGMQIMYQLEGGFSAGDGSLSGNAFGRVAKLGLTGSFGTVSAGLDWTPYDSAFNDALEYNGFSAMGGAWAKGAHSDVGNTGNGNAKGSVQYQTPDLSGFTATVMYAPGGDKTAVAGATSYGGLGLAYASGPVALNFAYESRVPTVGAVAANAWIAAGSYDLGVVKLFLGLEQADSGVPATGRDVGYSLGLSMPVGKQASFAVGYAAETNGVSGQENGASNSFGIQYVYNQTPALAFYVGYLNTADTPTAVGAQTTTTTTKTAFGARYNF